jgi:RNA polymerase II-associated factor 1
LEEDYSDKTDVKRSQRHATALSWMRRPDYISTEQTRYQPTTIEKIESTTGFATRKKMGADQMQSLFMDREAQITAIEKTFEHSKLPITEHYSKKGIYPVEVLPVLPDDEMWKYPCAQVKHV